MNFYFGLCSKVWVEGGVAGPKRCRRGNKAARQKVEGWDEVGGNNKQYDTETSF